MRFDMTADTGTCTSPTFGATSTPDLAVLNCKVTAVGALPITIKSAAGGVLYSATLTVPPPQVTLITSKGSVVMELNADVVPATVNNFLGYVNTGFYQSTLFHRVIAENRSKCRHRAGVKQGFVQYPRHGGHGTHQRV